MSTIKIGVLYTMDNEQAISFNPGDDIVRDGQKYLFNKAFGGDRIEWLTFNRNFPGRWYDNASSFLRSVKPKMLWPYWFYSSADAHNMLKECDYLINASGPLLYGRRTGYSAMEPWFLVLKRVLSGSDSPRFINLAFGSNFAQQELNVVQEKLATKFCREIAGCSEVLTCRDATAYEYVEKAGDKSRLLPCPSLLACKHHRVQPVKKPFILLNFHPAGSRSNSGQTHDSRWISEFEGLVSLLNRRKLELKFVFHEKLELELAKKFFPVDEYEYVIPETVPEFLYLYGSALATVTCRIHGAYAAASCGVPSFVVGHDTRLGMIDLLGLPYADSGDVTAEQMLQCVERFMNEQKSFECRLLDTCAQAEREYLDILSELKSPAKQHDL
jgi:polysaccharide pyruvyl transferase WcaK-like protein